MKKRKVLLTVHDCRFMERKHGINKLLMNYLYLKLPVAKSAYIVAISEATKKDIMRYTGCESEKITVIPVMIDEIYQPFPKLFNAQQPTILQVGVASNKNLNRLIEALKEVYCKIIIVGNLTIEQSYLLKKYNINYINYFNISKEDLLEQYKTCDIVSFVSTFEGFGMPIIEANCVERVVITSNISSMPEVAGDAACLVDPYSVEDIRQGILKLIHDEAYREQLIENGRKNRLRFNGNVIAEQYYQLYKQIAEGSNMKTSPKHSRKVQAGFPTERTL